MKSQINKQGHYFSVDNVIEVLGCKNSILKELPKDVEGMFKVVENDLFICEWGVNELVRITHNKANKLKSIICKIIKDENGGGCS